MNGVHYHLIINHISIFLVPFGFFALVWARVRKSKDMFWASVMMFVLAGIFILITKETGEMAEEFFKHASQYTKQNIHEHELASKFAVLWTVVLAVFAIAMGAMAHFQTRFQKAMQIFVLVLALFTCSVLFRTAYLGGVIEHYQLQDHSKDASKAITAPADDLSQGKENEIRD